MREQLLYTKGSLSSVLDKQVPIEQAHIWMDQGRVWGGGGGAKPVPKVLNFTTVYMKTNIAQII